ncbi:MAG: hypothetical protein MZU97_11850 [Bacillus subtilis]|nr:hypothetical protein [Bacillus subtilis]
MPYEVNKAELVRKIDDIRTQKKIDGIEEVRDESDREGLRIVIEIGKGISADVVLAYLMKNTDLSLSFNYNMVAISNKSPKQMCFAGHPRRLHRPPEGSRPQPLQLRPPEGREAPPHRRGLPQDGRRPRRSDPDDPLLRRQEGRDGEPRQELQLHRTAGRRDRHPPAVPHLQHRRRGDARGSDRPRPPDRRPQQDPQERNRTRRRHQEGTEDLLREVPGRAPKRDQGRDREGRDRRGRPDRPRGRRRRPHPRTAISSAPRSRSVLATTNGDAGLKPDDAIIRQLEVNTRSTLLVFTDFGNFIHLPVYKIPDKKWKEIGEYVGAIVPLATGEASHRLPRRRRFRRSQRRCCSPPAKA